MKDDATHLSLEVMKTKAAKIQNALPISKALEFNGETLARNDYCN